jgi:hypothetical protein
MSSWQDFVDGDDGLKTEADIARSHKAAKSSPTCPADPCLLSRDKNFMKPREPLRVLTAQLRIRKTLHYSLHLLRLGSPRQGLTVNQYEAQGAPGVSASSYLRSEIGSQPLNDNWSSHYDKNGSH